ncbi:hypothetical protein ES703_105641 [subsurface metagenome]
MRRLIMGVLVLLFASFAQGGLIFTVNGVPQPDEIWLFPSEIVELGLEIGAGHNIENYSLDYILSDDEAEFITDGASGSYPGLPPMTDIEFPAPFEVPGQMIINEPQHVQITAGQLFGPPLEGPQVLMKELYIHCLGSTDVVLEVIYAGITILDGVAIYPGPVEHTLTIHQIPEPITMSLLFLGSVFILRRRKH